MANRIYVVPVIGVGTHDDPRRPKYLSPPYAGWDYGFEPWMVVGTDLLPADHTALVANADVSALPVDLSQTLTGGQVTATKAFLETANIPAGWVTTALTWATVLRTVLGVFSFVQRFGFLYAQVNGSVPPTMFRAGISLDSTFGSLPVLVRNALLATAQDQGIATDGLTAGATIRVILKTMADTYAVRPLSINGLVI